MGSLVIEIDKRPDEEFRQSFIRTAAGAREKQVTGSLARSLRRGAGRVRSRAERAPGGN